MSGLNTVKPSSDIRICFFGDSFVTGTGDPTYLGWTGRVCAAIDKPVTHYNLGIRGNTSVQIESRWQAESSLRFPSDCDARVVFSFGVNDARIEQGKPLVPTEDSVACARSILTMAKAQYLTLLIGPPPVDDSVMNSRIAEISSAYAELCADVEVFYLDTFAAMSQSSYWMSEVALVDGAHPAAAGYEAFAKFVSQWSVWQDWFV
ncbi:MAG: GDSL-type esterase/lipase family protein [Cyanobacteria bacterium P01_F01_bin.53]